MTTQHKQKILIVDDSEMNRLLLHDILGDEYELAEATNGEEAVAFLDNTTQKVDLILLDIVMPKMDGFAFLEVMNQKGWIANIPVIMISAENLSASVVRAYDLGVSDFIGRPFDADIVRKRVKNTIMLYTKQKKLINMITQQIYEKEKQSGLLVTVLSHIVEFRNGESGAHVLHIQRITELLLKHIGNMHPEYKCTAEEVAKFSLASALHDIGKIAIPSEILNKPGRLTDEEFAVMKTHTTLGAQMLESLVETQAKDPLIQAAYQICRWHHERWDGRGYPDGLKEDAIPLCAQVVALADVYDALTSERVYKPAFSHETAVQMILDGKCGAFNPILLECLKQNADTLKTELEDCDVKHFHELEVEKLTAEVVAKAIATPAKVKVG